MKKLANWLLFGRSGSDVIGNTPRGYYNDSFFVISKNAFQVFTTKDGYDNLAGLLTLISNCNVHACTRAQEEEIDQFENIKVAKFLEMVFDKPSIAMPVHAIDETDFGAKTSQDIIEMWPLIQAYGLDSKFIFLVFVEGVI